MVSSNTRWNHSTIACTIQTTVIPLEVLPTFFHHQVIWSNAISTVTQVTYLFITRPTMLVHHPTSLVVGAGATVTLPLKEEMRRTLMSLQVVAFRIAFAVVSIRENASVLCYKKPFPLHCCPLVCEDFVGSRIRWVFCTFKVKEKSALGEHLFPDLWFGFLRC